MTATKLKATLDKAKAERNALAETKSRTTHEIDELQRKREDARSVSSGAASGLTEEERRKVANTFGPERAAVSGKLQESAQERAEKEQRQLGVQIDKLLEGVNDLDSKLDKANTALDAAQAAHDAALVENAHKVIPELARRVEQLTDEYRQAYNQATDGLCALESAVSAHAQAMSEASAACDRAGAKRKQSPKENFVIDYAELLEVPAVPLRVNFGQDLRRRYK